MTDNYQRPVNYTENRKKVQRLRHYLEGQQQCGSALKLGSEAHLGNASCKFHVLLSQNPQVVPPHARDFV
jgi:hypothetical protein